MEALPGACLSASGGATSPDGTGGFARISCPTAQRCYVVGTGRRLGGLWATGDGGQHWVKRRLPEGGGTALDFPTALAGWSSGDFVVYKTTDGGRNWQAHGPFADAGIRVLATSFVDSSRGWVCGEYGTMVRTADGGATWQWLETGSNADLSGIVFVDAMHGWASGTGGEYPNTRDVLLRTTDGGVTWQEL